MVILDRSRMRPCIHSIQGELMVIMTETVGPSSPREDPRITDEVVEAARRAREDVIRSIDLAADGSDWPDPMRAALEAAVPLLAPQPLVDWEAALQELLSYCHVQAKDGDATEDEQLAYDDVAIRLSALLNGSAK
jgi:hypothetical protein